MDQEMDSAFQRQQSSSWPTGREHRVQCGTNPLRLVLKRHVRHVANAIQGALRVSIQRGEHRIEVLLSWTGCRDELEGLAQSLIRAEAADQNLSDLRARNDTIAGVARLACIALQEDRSVLVWLVVVEPAGSHNRVRQSAGAHQSLGTPLPVVSLGGLVVFARAVCDSDGGHQRNAHSPRAQRAQDIANTSVIDVLSPNFSCAVRAKSEHDRINALDCASQRTEFGNVAYDHLRFGRKLAGDRKSTRL